MNKLEKLIKDLCPNSISFRSLEDCCIIHDNKRKPITKGQRVVGEYPYYGANGIQDYVENYIFDGSFVLVGEDGSVITDRGTPVVTWAQGKIWVNNHAHIISENENVILRYLYHYLQIIDVTSFIHGNIPKLTGSDFRNLKIAVPPLEVQREIVKILDNFTELTVELNEKLAAELTARKKQYEYYRDELMDFSKRTDLDWAYVGDYFTFKNGINKGKEYFGSGDYIVNFTDVYNNRWLTKDILKGRVQTESKDLIAYDVKKGDVFFTRTSETKEDIGMASTLIEDIERCVFSGFVLRARPLSNYWLPKFCSYYFSSSNIRKDIVRYASFTTRALTSGPRLSKLKIPLLPISEQERIVSILDRFDKLCNGISEGLPAEIAARQKQYEYYRNKLLTFKETENV